MWSHQRDYTITDPNEKAYAVSSSRTAEINHILQVRRSKALFFIVFISETDLVLLPLCNRPDGYCDKKTLDELRGSFMWRPLPMGRSAVRTATVQNCTVAMQKLISEGVDSQWRHFE